MGRYYRYKPRGTLLARLGEELDQSPDRILATLQRERVALLRERYPNENFDPWEVL